MHRGYVKLWRCIEDTGLVGQPTAFYLYSYLLLKATHKAKSVVVSGAVFDLDAGQVVIGRNRLADETGLSVQQVRTALELLKKLSIITCKATNKCTVISLVNWDTYQNNQPAHNQQNNQQSSQRPASDQPTLNQRLTTIQECKNINTEEDNTPHTPQSDYKPETVSLFSLCQSSASPSGCEFPPAAEDKPTKGGGKKGFSDDFNRFWEMYPRKVSKGQAWKTWQKLQKEGTLPDVDTLVEAIRWRQHEPDWKKDDGRYIPHASTWLNASGWEDEGCKAPEVPPIDPREERSMEILEKHGLDIFCACPCTQEAAVEKYKRLIAATRELIAEGLGDYAPVRVNFRGHLSRYGVLEQVDEELDWTEGA